MCIRDRTNEDFDISYQIAFMKTIAVIEEVDYKKIEDYMKDVEFSRNIKGKVITFIDDIKIVNVFGHTYVPS